MKQCSICGEKVNMFTSIDTSDKKLVCTKCCDRVIRGKQILCDNMIGNHLEISLNDWKRYLDNPQVAVEEWGEIERDKIVSYGKMIFNDTKKTITVPGFWGDKVYDYSQIYKYEYIEDHDVVSSGGVGIGRALVGGLLFGGAGAVIGGLSKKKNVKEKISDMKIRILFMVDEKLVTEIVEYEDIFVLNFVGANSLTYEHDLNKIEEILHKLDTISNEKEKVLLKEEETPRKEVDCVGQLKKLKSLYEEELISEEEYIEQKKRILNSNEFMSVSQFDDESLEEKINTMELCDNQNVQSDRLNSELIEDSSNTEEKTIDNRSQTEKQDIICMVNAHNVYNFRPRQQQILGDVLAMISLIQEEIIAHQGKLDHLQMAKEIRKELIDKVEDLANRIIIATKDHNTKRYEMAKEKLSDFLNGDTLILADDDALFKPKFKKGFAMGYNQVYFVRDSSKGEVYTISFEELRELCPMHDYDIWLLNDNFDCQISTSGGNSDYQLRDTLIIALIIVQSYIANGPDYVLEIKEAE